MSLTALRTDVRRLRPLRQVLVAGCWIRLVSHDWLLVGFFFSQRRTPRHRPIPLPPDTGCRLMRITWDGSASRPHRTRSKSGKSPANKPLTRLRGDWQPCDLRTWSLAGSASIPRSWPKSAAARAPCQSRGQQLRRQAGIEEGQPPPGCEHPDVVSERLGRDRPAASSQRPRTGAPQSMNAW